MESICQAVGAVQNEGPENELIEDFTLLSALMETVFMITGDAGDDSSPLENELVCRVEREPDVDERLRGVRIPTISSRHMLGMSFIVEIYWSVIISERKTLYSQTACVGRRLHEQNSY